MAALNEITSVNLMRLIGTPRCLAIVDVCDQDDFDDDPHVIPTAFHHPNTDLDTLMTRLRGQSAVIVCKKGLKLGHGIAAYLRAHDIPAQALTGGKIAWRDAGLPRVPVAAIPGRRWVTRHRPKIDRIACPWLIRRFVDPSAQFLFVPPSDVAGVADRLGATPFDTDIQPWTHVGDKCTFDALIDAFGLSHPALTALADVVRAADTDNHDASPQAAGLLAMSVGLSRMYRDDNAQLAAAMPLYDALYRWARDGQAEGHTWPDGGTE